MIRGRRPLALMFCAALVAGCAYIVVPAEEGGPAGGESKGWTAVATSVGPADNGDLRIDLTIQNQTGDWSAMLADGPAIDLPFLESVMKVRPPTNGDVATDELSIKKATRELEQELIKRALGVTQGNRTNAAKLLEISHRALLYKMKEYGIS